MHNKASKQIRTSLLLILSMVMLAAGLGTSPVSAAPIPPEPLISNDLFLYSQTVVDFDTQAFLDGQNSPLKDYAEQIDGERWSAADSIEYLAALNGLNPQVILVMLEAQAGLLTRASAGISDEGFYIQVKELAEALVVPYYARRDTGIAALTLKSGQARQVSETLNAGSYAVMAALAQTLPAAQWKQWVTSSSPLFKQTFTAYFGDSLLTADPAASEPGAAVVPTGFSLPFPVGETWYYTSGPHSYNGGVVGCTSGSGCPRPWSSIDLAPPESIACPGGAFPANRWIVAPWGGKVVKSQKALVVIDHQNGWMTYYSHVATTDRRALGDINQNNHIGHPSCEVEPYGKTNGVHLHFGLYKTGSGFVNIDGLTLTGWMIGESTHYNGSMSRSGQTRSAETGRHTGLNDILNSPLGFNSQFTSNAAGWTPVKGAWSISSAGQYHTPGISGMFNSTRYKENYPTLTYTVRLKSTSCSNCGNYLYFRGVPGPVNSDGRWNNGYVFEYSNNGYFTIGKQVNGSWVTLQNWTYSSAISSTWNTLKVTAKGNFMQFFINNVRVAYGNFPGYSTGQVGIGFLRDYSLLGHLYVDYATLTTTAPASAVSTAGVYVDELNPQDASQDSDPGHSP
jgi:hypothetical protein